MQYTKEQIKNIKQTKKAIKSLLNRADQVDILCNKFMQDLNDQADMLYNDFIKDLNLTKYEDDQLFHYIFNNSGDIK